MPAAVVYTLSFVFVLGVLVFVHELGHFLAAKRVGIRVLKFQLGFNPTILSYKYGDTLQDTITKLEYDLYYIKNMSIALDNYILFHTLKAMLLSRGAQ